MHIEGNRQGTLVTNLPGIAQYQSFNPSALDSVLPLNLGESGTALLARCSRKVGEMEGMSRFVPNADMYLTMYVRKEALLSSQIEGTQCTFDDVLDPSNNKALSRDVADVINYVNASEFAVAEMSRVPLCLRLFKGIHERLLSGVRGQDKHPGEVRTSQNWIGPAGCTIQDAAFVPPNVEDMHRALGDLERFMNRDDIDPIIKAALSHYQFETIHPFLDGNGRLGRLLITLSLMNDGVLSLPLFYPSYQLKLRRNEYYDRLTAVRVGGDYEGWVLFFCECMIAAAEDAANSLGKLVTLHEESARAIRAGMGRTASNGLLLLEYLEGHPIVTPSMVQEALLVSRTTASGVVDDFVRLGVLRDVDASRRRYKTYAYEDYLSVLRAGGDPL